MKTRSTLWLAASASLLLLLAACTPGGGPANGNLDLAITPPSGAAASDIKVTVSGPSGTSTVNASKTLSLKPGTYSISVADLKAGGFSYKGTANPSTVTVQSGKTANSTVAYTATTGKLTVKITAPTGVNVGAVTVAGPGGFNASLTADTTFDDVAPGDYTITAPDIAGYKKAGDGTVNVTAGKEAISTVAYAKGLGSVTVTVSGLPANASAPTVTLSNSDYTATSNGPTYTFTNVPTGTYSVTGSTVAIGSINYTAAAQTVSLPNDGSTANATLNYVADARSITVTVTGAPSGSKLVVTATPSSGSPVIQTGTAGTPVTLGGLSAVDYTITAQALTAVNTYASTSGVSAPVGSDSPSIAVVKKNTGWLFAMGNGQLLGSDQILVSLGDGLENATVAPNFITTAFANETPTAGTKAQIRVAVDSKGFFYIARQRGNASCGGGSGAACDVIEVWKPASYQGIDGTNGFNVVGNGAFTIATTYTGEPNRISDLTFAPNGDLWVAVQGTNGLLCYSNADLETGRTTGFSNAPDPAAGNPNGNGFLVTYKRHYVAAASATASLNDVRALAFDKDGNLWVASASKISRIAAADATCKTTTYPAQVLDDDDIGPGPDKVTPNLILDLAAGANVFSLAFDAGRNALWATDYTAGSVFEVPLATNAASGPLATGLSYNTGIANAAGLAVDNQGNLWVGTDGNNTGKVVELIPGTSSITAGRPAYTTSPVGITSIAIATKTLP